MHRKNFTLFPLCAVVCSHKEPLYFLKKKCFLKFKEPPQHCFFENSASKLTTIFKNVMENSICTFNMRQVSIRTKNAFVENKDGSHGDTMSQLRKCDIFRWTISAPLTARGFLGNAACPVRFSKGTEMLWKDLNDSLAMSESSFWPVTQLIITGKNAATINSRLTPL